MKFSNLLTFLAFMLFAGSLFGQRIKDKRAKITYVSLPTEKLPDDFSTYSVNVYGHNLSVGGGNPESASNRIKMDGFKRVSYVDGGGHLRVIVNTGYTRSGNAEYKNKKNTHKDKETGKETVTYEYWYEMPFSTSTSYQIIDPEGNILDSGGNNFSETKRTSTYSKSADLRKNYSSQINALRKSFANDAANSVINQANLAVAKKFDFNKTHEYENLYLIAKHDTEDGFEKYYKQIDDEWKDLDAATPTEELKAKFGDALAFYEKTAQIEPKGDKKLERVFEAANYNAALLNYYLGNFEAAVRYSNRVIAQEGKHKRSSDIIEKSQASKALMDLHGIQTMHYERDLSNAMAPAAIKAIELEEEELADENNLLEGSIILNGEKVVGRFASEKESDELDFSESGNTVFMIDKDGERVEYNMMNEGISAFSIGDRSFVKMKFAPCAKGKAEAADNILEEVYKSDKITLYKYYPATGALADGKTEYAFKKVGDESPVSLYDTQFLILKKGLANYFSDCADLKSMCEEGSIENEEESLLQAARIYAEVCE
ncbi:MAG: hypothetical protein R2825_20120 [Saprospiraceae bacterium]